MRIYSYHHDLKQDYPADLIARWKTSWASTGFVPLVLSEEDAKKHPLYARTVEYADTLPTPNMRQIERSCWVRWLAYEQVAPALFSDYDAINLSVKPGDIPTNKPMVALECPTSPGLFWAMPSAIRYFIDAIPGCSRLIEQWHGSPYVADVVLYRDLWPKPDRVLSVRLQDGRSAHTPCVHMNRTAIPDSEKICDHVDKWLAERKARTAP